MDEVLPPALRTVEAQLNSVRFLASAADGRWTILKSAWPHYYVRVTGKDPDSGHTFSHDFHLECQGYPDPGPFVERWAFADNAQGGSRPPPPRVGSPGFIDAMKDWDAAPGTHGGIYRAWQRHASAHNGWAAKHPGEAWHRKRDIVFIMEHLYALVSEQAVWLGTHS